MTEERKQGSEAKSADELFSFDEAIKFLDTSKSTLYRLLSQDDIKGVKVGKQWRFRKGDLTAYLERGPVAVAVDGAARVDLEAELDFFTEAWLTVGQQSEPALSPSSEQRTPEAKIVELADRIVFLAIVGSAGDIHLEPSASSLRLRYRIDGVLHDIRRLPMSLHESLLTRFKEMAEMNLSEKRVPQDGRISIQYRGKEYDLRMSVLPTLYGENAVIRILDRTSVLLGLEKLETRPDELDALRTWMHQSRGLILATGPTGAGKTTLLYSCLQEVNTAEKNVLTIEDPIEHRLADITQVQVNKRVGVTFAGVLRSFIRQDPDVILCGEIRDIETVEMMVEASLTGHLVLSVLHTEDTLSALLRLDDMGLARYLVTATLLGVVATRLARKLCAHCKTVSPLEEGRPVSDKLRRLTENGGYRIPQEAVFYSAAGCPRCHGTGYQGRMGLYEILNCTPPLVAQLYQCGSHEERTRLAVLAGVRTLLADGMQKAVEGETSIDEVLRATGTWL